MTRPAFLLALASATALPAHAQEAISYSWRFVEVTTGTDTPVTSPNGVLEPGESARLELTALVVPGMGVPVTFAPPPPGMFR